MSVHYIHFQHKINSLFILTLISKSTKIIIITNSSKPIPKDRISDIHLTEILFAEKRGIFRWCIEGLERLITNNFEFTVSDQTKDNLRRFELESNNIIPFMESEHDFKYDALVHIHSQELYWASQNWCRLNGLDELSRRTFRGYLKSHTDDHNITYSDWMYTAGQPHKKTEKYVIID